MSDEMIDDDSKKSQLAKTDSFKVVKGELLYRKY